MLPLPLVVGSVMVSMTRPFACNQLVVVFISVGVLVI